MNFALIAYILGLVLDIEAGCMVLPLICSLIYKENTASMWIICIAVCLCLGLPLSLKRPKNRNLFAKEGFAVVALSWIVISIFGAIPFFISKSIPNFIDAVFEIASGFTTTGASILYDIEALPHSILFWRSFSHWIGGMGVLVFLVALLPKSGGDNMYLVRAESPGPSVSKLVPKVGVSAKLLYIIYVGITALEVVFLLFGGTSLFESLTMAFGTAGTGGFAVKNTSIAGYSPYIQWVITVFMILFGVDFAVHYILIKKRFKESPSEEVKVYLTIILAAATLIIINCSKIYPSISETIRHGFFQTASIITTTGFSTADFDKWPEFSKAILVALMFIGACAGSTGGGIKVSRIVILFKSIIKQIQISAHPNRTIKLSMDGRPVEHETLRAVNVFIAAYILIFVVSVLIISLDNFNFTTNYTAVAATINNIGPGLDKVGPAHNFAEYSNLSKIVLIGDMLIGRLEIFPFLILFSRKTWKK
ncbi:MAG: TrkH family potassium uptake protein [Clostridia bacterium]|nr:TrkH family potassium uptake protein [Clostridia bacterium]